MGNERMACRLVFAAALLLAASSGAPADVIYVDQDATGNNDGTSWTDAYTDLEDGRADCTAGDQVWVAEGTYVAPVYWGFRLVDGCGIYGGFASGETQLEQRNPAANETILSGDRNGDDPIVTDNVEHVVWVSSSVGPTGVLDGFTITAGCADGSTYFDKVGAGMIVFGGSPTLGQLIFRGNHADTNGGAMNIGSGSLLTIDRSEFYDNDSVVSGGAVYITQSSDATFTNCLFHDNAATGVDPVGAGGAFHIVGSEPEFVNCTFADNTAGYFGGGILIDCILGGSDPILTNCILWNNSDASGVNEDSNLYICAGSPVVTYTDWQGHTGGTGNIDADPLFVDAENSDYHLDVCSPCVDVGNNNAAAGLLLDLDGEARIENDTIDMGAYERDFKIIYVDGDATGTGDGTSWGDAYTDLGAAMQACLDGEDLWVAEGVYRAPEYWGFRPVNCCKIYGGFAGTEPDRDDRDPAANETILSGDRNDDDPVITDNAHHVVWVSTSVGPITVLDGFTITAGYADGSGYFDQVGAGMIVFGGSPTLAQLVFHRNHADTNGGAINIGSGSELWIDRSKFYDNDSVVSGGAIYITQDSDATFSNCLFHHNEATGVEPVGAGGAFHIVASDPTLVNVTIANNAAGYIGGGILIDCILGGSDPILTNCILWDNSDASGVNEDSNLYICAGSPVVTYTDWQGHIGGEGNIDDDPNFTIDYEPRPVTDVINGGDNSAVFTTLDLGNKPRILQSIVDMGAYEWELKIIKPPPWEEH